MDPQTKKMIEEMMKLTSHLGDQVQYHKMLHDPLYGQRGECPSALQVAQAFGSDDDKKENYLEVWNDYRKLQKLGDFVNQGITGRPGSEKMLNEFCSKYLPCFIRALRKSPDQSRELYSGLFVYLIPSPQFHRYLREHPESKGFLGWLCTMFAKEVPNYIEMTVGTIDSGPGVSSCGRLMFFDLLAWQILLHVELQKNTKTDIDVSPSVKAQLVKKLRSLQAEERATRGRRTFEDPQLEGSLFDSVRMSYSIVDWLDGITTIEEIVERDLQAGRTLPWIHCALRKEGGCKALGKGVEMQACSRCKAVRYCSPEHQKANWKAHKPMCLLPTWGPSLP